MASPQIANRRETERVPVNRQVELTTARAAGDFFDGTVIDFSEFGLRVFTRRFLSRGDRVTVHWGQRRLTGVVVHSIPQGNGLSVGIQLASR